jgi:CBS domain-containing protein
MANVRIGSLPVVEGTRLVGIVTEHDVLKALAATLPCVKGADPDTYLW